MIHDALDQNAIALLAKADLERAIDAVKSCAAKPNVRDPNAFIVQALSSTQRKPRPVFGGRPVFQGSPAIAASVSTDADLPRPPPGPPPNAAGTGEAAQEVLDALEMNHGFR